MYACCLLAALALRASHTLASLAATSCCDLNMGALRSKRGGQGPPSLPFALLRFAAGEGTSPWGALLSSAPEYSGCAARRCISFWHAVWGGIIWCGYEALPHSFYAFCIKIKYLCLKKTLRSFFAPLSHLLYNFMCGENILHFYTAWLGYCL